jgi:putative flavoprotein involved in K+ transport
MIIQKWLEQFENAIKNQQIDAVTSLFNEDCYWRDLLCFTWNIKTLEGKQQIEKMLNNCLNNTQAHNWRLNKIIAENENGGEAVISFETKTAIGSGYIRLVNGKCHTLLTAMDDLKGFIEPTWFNTPIDHKIEFTPNRLSYSDLREKENNELGFTRQPYCLIVGGGQSGITLAARLKQLKVPTLIIDKNPHVGDAWRKRYDNLHLHDPIWADHYPYIPFPENWPAFPSKDKIADWLEAYSKIMELNYWTGTECIKASFNENSQLWEVEVNKNGKLLKLYPQQLVIANGLYGSPQVPTIKGSEQFKGTQLHSSQYKNGKAFKQKNCIVVGSNTSAHDICFDLCEQGANSVTMIQRSSTTIMQIKTLMEKFTYPLYSPIALNQGITTQFADLKLLSTPYKLLIKDGIVKTKEAIEEDKEFYDKLKTSGFLFDFGHEDSGCIIKYLRDGVGYYYNTGASDLIIDGSIKVQSDCEIVEINQESITLSNGNQLQADVIIFATGYSNMSQLVAELISPEVAKKIGKVWGLGSGTKKDPGPWDGELRNMWKPTKQQGLWINGASLQFSRIYSKFLALQIKARYENIASYDLVYF